MILKDTEKINVNIKMKTFQESEVLEHSYIGTFTVKNKKKYLLYNDGYEKCSLTSDGKIIRLTRFKSNSVMVFEKNAEHITSYMTPMGNMSLAVKTKGISDRLCIDGSLSINYDISVGDTDSVQNKIIITIEEIKNVSK